MPTVLARWTLAGAAVLLGACSSVTTLSSSQADARLSLRDKHVSLPSDQSLKGTSFGNYEVKVESPGSDPLYGILPLKFKGGHLAVDIVLFAPAAFFNLRAPFRYYDFDVAQGVIRYRNTPEEAWQEYRPKPEEAARARSFFGTGNTISATVEH